MYKIFRVFKNIGFFVYSLRTLKKYIEPIHFKYFCLIALTLIVFHSSKAKANDYYVFDYFLFDNNIASQDCSKIDFNTNIGFFAAKDLFLKNDYYAASGYSPLVRDASYLHTYSSYKPSIWSGTLSTISSNNPSFSALSCMLKYNETYGVSNVFVGSATVGCYDENYNHSACYSNVELTSTITSSINFLATNSLPSDFCSSGVIELVVNGGNNIYFCSANNFMSVDQNCLGLLGQEVDIYLDKNIETGEYYPLSYQTYNFLGSESYETRLYCGLSYSSTVSVDGTCKHEKYKYNGDTWNIAEYELGNVPPEYHLYQDPNCEYLKNGEQPPEPTPTEGIIDDLENLEIEDPTGKYNKDGFDENCIHRDTKTEYDNRGFDCNGIHKDTGTPQNPDDFDKDGVHKDTGTNHDPNGFDNDGIHKDTGDNQDSDGYDKNGNDENGFDREGNHKDTGTNHDPNGFDSGGNHQDTGTNQNPSGETQKDLNDQKSPNIDNSNGAESYYESAYPDGASGVFKSAETLLMQGSFGDFIKSFDLEKKFGSSNEYPVFEFDLTNVNPEFGSHELQFHDVSGYNLWIILKGLFLLVTVFYAFRIVL